MRTESGSASNSALRGERITLRPPRPADAREVGLLVRKSATVYRTFNSPLKNKAQFEEYLQRCRRDDYFGFLICRNEDGLVVGNINLFHIILSRLRSACVGYFVGAPHCQQRY